MKITLNKRDCATIVRNCMKAREGFSGCSNCALAGVCSGPETLEDNCIIDREKEAVNDISNLH